jgi:hypothetical protein
MPIVIATKEYSNRLFSRKGTTMAGDQQTGMPEHAMPEWKAIASAVAEVQLFWRFHVRFCGNDEDVALMQDILPFPFRIIRKALLLSMTMEIGKLMDKDETTIRKTTLVNLSLRRLVKLLNPHCPDLLKSRLGTMLDELETLYEPIGLWRDKRFGHSDKEMVLGLGPKPFPDVEQQRFEQVLALMRDLLKAVHTHFNGADEPMYFPEPTGDADRLLDYIRTGHNAKQRELEGLLP